MAGMASGDAPRDLLSASAPEGASPAPDVAIPAATVVLLRDAPGGVSTLMLHRSSKVAFGGMWVFPGGRVDPGDHAPGDADDLGPARRAAVREAVEEAGLRLEPHELVPISHWTPPPLTPRRYLTWFFVARAGDGDVVVDGHEIHDHAWLTPAEVLERRDRGEVVLAPPTFVTLSHLLRARDVDDAVHAARSRPPHRYATRWATTGVGAVAMWQGDAGYEAEDPDAAGPRHRLWMGTDTWRFEQTP